MRRSDVKPTLLDVLAQTRGWEDAAVHDAPDTVFEELSCYHRAAEIEFTVGRKKGKRPHRAGQHDRLAGVSTVKKPRGLTHRAGAVGDHDRLFPGARHGCDDCLSVSFVEVQAVL